MPQSMTYSVEMCMTNGTGVLAIHSQAPVGATEYTFTLKPTQIDAFEIFEGCEAKVGRGVQTAVGVRMKRRVLNRPFALDGREWVIEKDGREYTLREYDPTGSKSARPIREPLPPTPAAVFEPEAERLQAMVARLTKVRV